MKNSIFLLTILLLAHSININAQVSQEWVARFDDGSSDYASDMVLDQHGNIYLTGSSNSKAGWYSTCFITNSERI
ncbi:MAG TPA: SBBP repeat-containing protein [Ignavibacteria bacterium]